MIEPNHRARQESGTVQRQTDYERLMAQVETKSVAIGPDAARRIARRIEAQGGFWDLPRHQRSEGDDA